MDRSGSKRTRPGSAWRTRRTRLRLRARPQAAQPKPLPPVADRLAVLGQSPQADAMVFQAVVVQATAALERVLHSEKQVAAAAMSLAQRELASRLTATTEAAWKALHALLGPRGDQLRRMQLPPARPPAAPESLWWFALAEALHALEHAQPRLQQLVRGQARHTPARLLVARLLRLLRQHHRLLLREADAWMN